MRNKLNLAANIYSVVYAVLLWGSVAAILILTENGEYTSRMQHVLSINSLIYAILAVPHVVLVAKSDSLITSIITVLIIFPLFLNNLLISVPVFLALTVAYSIRKANKAIPFVACMLAFISVACFNIVSLAALGDEMFERDYEAVSYSPDCEYVIYFKDDHIGEDDYYVAENKKLWLVFHDLYPTGREINIKCPPSDPSKPYEAPKIEWIDNGKFTVFGEVYTAR